MKRTKIGDIIEIPVSGGFRYAQYSHHNPMMGALLRILPGTYTVRPPDLKDVVNEETLYYVFFPVKEAVSRGIFQTIGNFHIPGHSERFPLFRCASLPDREGKVQDCWLWDGNKDWRVGAMRPEHRDLPIQEIWNDTCLVEKLEAGWLPRDDI